MKNFIVFSLGFLCLVLAACSQNVPMRTSINEHVLTNMSTSSQRGVNLLYDSELTTNRIPLYRADRTLIQGAGSDYYCDQAGTLKTMLTQYLGNRFHEINPTATFKLELTLVNFYVERHVMNANFMHTLEILAGENTESNYMNKAVVEVMVKATGPSGVISKTLSASAEGNATDTTMVNSLSEVINQANNRILILLNNYLSENNL
ncbi:MAG TPA: hypothetical protein PLX59_01170 [Candidatus Cloacimonadota bacterium]|nr:hypothetical protein [Candidatus Cloacimonadota bacterium]